MDQDDESPATPGKASHPMLGVNSYWYELTPQEIDAGAHRDMVGALWDELGPLQLAFLLGEGLKPHHRVLDMGCGALRTGLHLIRHLEPGHYYGLDINASLIAAGTQEVAAAGLANKDPSFLVEDAFRASKFAIPFDVAIAQSLFTHLSMDFIVRCLVEIRHCLAPAGRFYATFFEAPTSAHLEPFTHQPGHIQSHYDRDPFHQSTDEMQWLGNLAGLEARYMGDWGHPRAQKMMAFTHRKG